MGTNSGDHPISISVVIPAFNAESYIERALDSILQQTSPADEIIVVDDGSTDQTAVKIKKYEPYITYLYQKNSGANEARNLGIQRAAADWIALLDADDQWLPDKLAIQREILERYPHLVWAYGNYTICKARCSMQDAHRQEAVQIHLKEGSYFDDFLRAYAYRIPVHTITMIVKKTALAEIGLFLAGQKIGHDPDVALRLAYRYPGVGYSAQPLAIHYFGRQEGITQKTKRLLEEKKEFLLRHLEMSAQFDKRPLFEVCAQMLLKRWIREAMEEYPGEELESFIRQFRPLIPRNLKAEAWLRRRLPWVASPVLDFYFKLKNQMRREVIE
jgi:glycosyltransferase involved in cell wall biosynthesis